MRMTYPAFLCRLIGSGCLIALLLAGCDGTGAGDSASRPGGAARPRPAVQVMAIRLQAATFRPRIERGCRFHARRRARLRNLEAGTVEAVAAEPGDRVAAGTVLVRLDDRALQAELAKARASRRQAELDLERLERLRDQRLATEETRQRARTALELARAEERLLALRVARMQIRAPFDGVISARLVEPGETIPAQTHLLTLIAPETLAALADVPLSGLPLRMEGLAFAIRAERPGAAWTPGHLVRLGPEADPASGLVTLEVRPAVPLPGVMEGAPCRMRIQLPPREGLLLPPDALRRDASGEYVYVIDQGRARRREVRSGAIRGERIEILAGLQPGEAVVVRGFLGLRDGVRVRVKEPQP